MENNRKYPEVSFVDTGADTLKDSLIKSYEDEIGRKLYDADPVRLFICWLADIIVQERVLINESAKQNVPRYAEGEYLDSLAELFRDTKRLEPSRATTRLRFYLSDKPPKTQLIPKGTRVTVDGNITFETKENLYITDEEKTVPEKDNPTDNEDHFDLDDEDRSDIDTKTEGAKTGYFGEVDAVCLTAGTAGNGFDIGQINQIVDVYQYYDKVENITVSSGGGDGESDEAFYKRMRESMETFSTAGSVGSYIYHTKTVSPKITDVVALSPRPGDVRIYVLLENGEVLSEELKREIMDALSHDKIRPLTDRVKVCKVNPQEFSIDIVYYLAKSCTNASEMDKKVNEAVEKYKKWQTEKLGRHINPSRLISMVMETGVEGVKVNYPKYLKVDENMVAKVSMKKDADGNETDEEDVIICVGGINNEQLQS